MECKDIAWFIIWGLPMIGDKIWKCYCLAHFLLIKEIMIIRPDLKPLYSCHDIKDRYDWLIYVFMIYY